MNRVHALHNFDVRLLTPVSARVSPTTLISRRGERSLGDHGVDGALGEFPAPAALVLVSSPFPLFFLFPSSFSIPGYQVLDQGTSLVHTAGKVVQSYRSTLQSDAAYHHKTEILTSSRLRALCAVRERATNKRLFRALVLKQQLSLFLP